MTRQLIGIVAIAACAIVATAYWFVAADVRWSSAQEAIASPERNTAIVDERRPQLQEPSGAAPAQADATIDSSSSANAVRKSEPIAPEGEADWLRIYGPKSRTELEGELAQLRKDLAAMTRADLRARIAAGDVIQLSNDSSLRAGDSRVEEIALVEMLPKAKGGGVVKAVLPRENFPDAYRLKDKIDWIAARLAGAR